MSEGGAGRDAPFSAWASCLHAIASPERLRLLSLLTAPRSLAELEALLGPEIQLEEYEDGGEASSRIPDPGAHPIDRDPIALEEPLEEIPTASVPPTWDSPASGSPSLTVVHGGPLGRSFPLRGEPNDPGRGWVIGYGEDADIEVGQDRHVEAQAGDVERCRGTFQLVDLRTAERRLSVNGRALERGETRELEDGDLIGVGRSLLHFRNG